MLQDKPAVGEAPLIILLFGNGDLCSQNTGQSISYSMKKRQQRKKVRSIRSAGRGWSPTPTPPPLTFPARPPFQE